MLRDSGRRASRGWSIPARRTGSPGRNRASIPKRAAPGRAQAADYLAPRYVRGSGILTGFGDLIGIYRDMGIPLRETFTPDNGLPFDAAVLRPELFLHEQWVVTMGGHPVQSAVNRAARLGHSLPLEQTIMVKDAPVIEIYRR